MKIIVIASMALAFLLLYELASDLTWRHRWRRGAATRDVYLTITTGLNGTSMPPGFRRVGCSTNLRAALLSRDPHPRRAQALPA